MDMSNFRSELHIAQQSRRDKLRIQQDLSPYVNNFPQNFDSAADRSCRSGNICYDPSEFCPEMINFSASNPLLKDGLMGHHQPEKRGGVEAQFPTSFHPSVAAGSSDGGGQYFNTWKSVASQSNSNWVTNQSSIMNCINPISALDVKPNYVGFQGQQLPSPSEMNGNSTAYQNALQELVTSSNVRTFGLEFASLRQKSEAGNGHWAVGGSELLLLPAYADQMRLKNQSDLITRPMNVDNCSHQWSSGEEFNFAAAPKAAADRRDHSNTQALSLSLSSVPSPRVHETQNNEKDFQTRDVCGSNNSGQDSRTWISPSQNKNLGMQAAASTHRNPGPLGPFTGYATILRSSKFLRPAQQLLEELCCIARPKNVEICDVSDEIMEEVRVSSGGVCNGEQQHVLKGVAGGSDSGVSSFAFDGCSDKGRDHGGASCSSEVYRPESLQRKAKLLFMQDEVCKRYKQYHQQMQMVVSSFETVAGLSAATPYVSLALKMISKHFRSLKNAITDQIKSTRNALGEELSSPSGGTSSSKGDGNVSMLKFFDQSFQKQKGSGSNNLGNILEGQHIWRPQRGLPERAVSILRAWLFDHFLHPYPTDTDKHMLASQTGLTRNQVSNWFINARVRVWKPMVEEIHMLEMKGADNGGKSSTNGKTAVEGCDELGDDNSSQSLNRLRMRAIPDKQVECSTVGRPEQETDSSNVRMWNNQEKRSRIEYHVPGGADGSLMGLVTPSHHHRSGGIEMSGIGSVSLTLGLRQSAENAQQERHLRHYGGQMIRDFVG